MDNKRLSEILREADQPEGPMAARRTDRQTWGRTGAGFPARPVNSLSTSGYLFHACPLPKYVGWSRYVGYVQGPNEDFRARIQLIGKLYSDFTAHYNETFFF